MTLNEFKAWLDGYAEAIGQAPTAEQWAKIREKLETVQGLTYRPVPNPYPGAVPVPAYPGREVTCWPAQGPGVSGMKAQTIS